MIDFICRPLNKSNKEVDDFNEVSDQLQDAMTAIEMINITVNALAERQAKADAQLVEIQQHLGLDASLNHAGTTTSIECVYMFNF